MPIVKKLHTAVFIFLLVSFALLLAAPTFAVEYGGLGARPTNPDPNNPRTSSIFVYSLAPNDKKQDAVTVYNNGSEAKDILIYAVDAQVSNTGAFTCEQQSDKKDRVGDWIKLSASELSLEPTKSIEVSFTVTMPAQVDVGEHNGCIVIQEKQRNDTEESSGVSLSFRSALRVAITAPGDITKDLDFQSFEVVKNTENKTYVLSPSLSNSGNVSVDAELSVNAKNIFQFANFSDGGKFPVLARQSASFNFEMPQPFWGGIYKTSASATYNSDPNAILGVEDGETRTINATDKWVVVPPKPLALMIELTALLLIFGGISYWLRSKRHIKYLRNSWQMYTVKSGDDVKSIASSHHVSWKKFAKINKLKPPYSLHSGQKVRVPKTSKTKSEKK